MKILHLKGCKWFLSQNQRVRNKIFVYRLYEALAKHVNLFYKNINVNGRQCLDYYNGLVFLFFMKNSVAVEVPAFLFTL